MTLGFATSRHEGPEIRTMAMPALPGPVDTAYMVSLCDILDTLIRVSARSSFVDVEYVRRILVVFLKGASINDFTCITGHRCIDEDAK